MADLSSLAGIEAELADTADYDVVDDVSKAKRRAVALRRRLDFPQSSGRGEQDIGDSRTFNGRPDRLRIGRSDCLALSFKASVGAPLERAG